MYNPNEIITTSYVMALRNTHAMEVQALNLMRRQADRIQHYPEMLSLLQAHIDETEIQRQRLEDALAAIDEDYSAVKESVMGFLGNMLAMAHIPAEDEILKNTLANHAFENYEIAAYKALIAIAEEAGQHRFIPAFQQSLLEEKTMAENLYQLLEPTIQRYLTLSAAGGFDSAKI